MIAPLYKAQVELLLDIIPYVDKEKCFALKGGTAINLFIWEMLRLSVDIDLTYLPFDNRNLALAKISESVLRIKDSIAKNLPGVQVEASGVTPGQKDRLLCSRSGTKIKVEVNTTMRGSINPLALKQVVPAARKEFGKFAAMQVVSDAEIFGGKICAALDRQHPRDLFDIHQLFDAGGITEEIKDGFIAALLSHNRPMHELLKPNFQDQIEVFANQFQGMTLRPFTYADYENARIRLTKEVSAMLTENDKNLLLSFKAGHPDWSLSKTQRLQDLPAVKWKLQNILKLQSQDSKKHEAMLKNLRMVLSAKN